MNNKLLPAVKEDAFNRISRFLSNEESGIVLTAKEEGILSRWIYANGLMKERVYTEDEVIAKIEFNFKVSAFTARNDINNARSLFVQTTKALKKYTLHHLIEDISLKIGELQGDPAFIEILPKYYDSLTKAIKALPDEIEIPDVATPVIIYNIVPGQSIPQPLDPEAALKAADELIELEKQNDYLEFDENTDTDGKQ